ncbi:TRAP transporter small permease [Alphaproteobacteria bacterium KMM 3653]|uniref:TRAP transporter small permease protein n=1 Tax=Harenicola maris TaxID=2841044 RepID=A0AAP2G5N1_9RHOB|nr:TRAP transporter small permease [Harenicola maris]
MAKAMLEWIVKALEVLASVVLMAMMLLTFVDVVGRYFVGAPIFGATEMISTMLALIIFIGLGIANARDNHIVVELVDSRFRALSPKVYDAIVQGFSILAMCLIVYVLYEQAVEAAHTGAKTVVLEWPLSAITGTVAALAGLSVISQVLGLIVGEGRDSHSASGGNI